MMLPEPSWNKFYASMATAQTLEWICSAGFLSKSTGARIAVKRWLKCWIARLRRPFEIEKECEEVIGKIERMSRLVRHVAKHFSDHEEARMRFIEQMRQALEGRKNGY